MAGLRVFISSTCYDLSLLRSQLRVFIQSMGYEPIMSDFEDVLYDPRVHTHTSCVNEVSNCDMLLLIIGSRFGGQISIESLNSVNFDCFNNESFNTEILKNKESLSVTQLEVIKAIENYMPVYTFIDKKVWHDHQLYEKNKKSEIIEQIQFPSIEKQETAKFIFNFINFVRLRTKGNNIFTFEKGQEIEEILRKQWASYFQRLLNEQRHSTNEMKNLDMLGEQFEELKTAILSSIDNGDQREIARGVVRFRRMFDFLFCLKDLEIEYLESSEDDWDDVLKTAKISFIIDLDEDETNSYRPNIRTYVIRVDDFYYSSRISKNKIGSLAHEWDAFKSLKRKSREIIIETLSEIGTGLPLLRFEEEKLGAPTANTNIEKRMNYKIDSSKVEW
nr:DUF4062 domain-containing protein [uncultured Acetobacterium sp.]